MTKLLLVVLPAVLLLLSGGCSSPPPSTDPVNPVVTVGVANLTPSERTRVTRFFNEELPDGWVLEPAPRIVEASALRTGDEIEGAWFLKLPEWSALEEMHRLLSELRDEESNAQILTNVQTDAIFYYTSSSAQADSEALVKIRVAPMRAALYFDTEMPKELNLEADKPVSTASGMFAFKPSFRFIRANAFLYFHSVYEGQTRYYEYDMEAQSQRLLQGVSTAEQFQEYLDNK